MFLTAGAHDTTGLRVRAPAASAMLLPRSLVAGITHGAGAEGCLTAQQRPFHGKAGHSCCWSLGERQRFTN